MRVMLVHTNRERSPQPAIPLGPCLVASSLEPAGFQPRVVDLCFSKEPTRELDRALDDFRPEAIGLSVRNLDNGDFLRPRSYLVELANLAQHLRAKSRAPLIIGGAAVSISPKPLCELLQADYAIAGEGEQTFPALLEMISGPAGMENPLLQSLPGVYLRGAKGSQGTPAQVSDIETLPFAQIGRWLDLTPYLRAGCALPIQTKRGCPFECIYCTYPQLEGSHPRLRSPRTVVVEMHEAQRRWRLRSFELVDSVFNHPLEHALGLCEAILETGLRAQFHTTGLTPAATSLELFRLMKRAGFSNVVCAPDGASEISLTNLRKGFSLEQVAKAATQAREADLPILWSFIFGAPGENDQTVRAALRFMNTAFGPKDRFACTLGLRIYPGAELAAIAKEEGVISPEANLLHPTFYFSPAITPARVLSMLEASPLRGRMIYLSALQTPAVALALRLRKVLHLPGPPWAYLPLFNRLTRLSPQKHRKSGRI